MKTIAIYDEDGGAWSWLTKILGRMEDVYILFWREERRGDIF